MGGILKYNDESWTAVTGSYQAEIKSKGEDAARLAGSILDVSKDGYYNTQKCIADFEKVSSNKIEIGNFQAGGFSFKRLSMLNL